ncbi:Transcription factor GAMYB [Dendrobium catenatum]|uniref:Transcription factor GAMYB n=1 Tax=Dendrobium catenatum TaxID=906689 RepID=A0A2I0WCF7_9ASPA|nr:Transcription factor GAMYB [Dendrobium catenatum]
MPSHGLGYYTGSFLNPQGDHVKQTWESKTSFLGSHFGLNNMVTTFEDLSSLNYEPIYLNPSIGYPYDPDPKSKKNLTSFNCPILSNPTLSNGNFSSSMLLPGAVKMDLPSLQSTEADYNDWNTSASLFTSSYDAVDSYIQSPENVSVQSDCASPKNKGLLEYLVHESKAISIGKKQSLEKSFDDTITGNITVKLKEIRDPTSPFCLSTVSLFNECSAKKDKCAPNLPDFLRPDVLLGSGWFIGNSRSAIDSISGPLCENLREVRVPVPTGISSMASLESYPWTNMPRVSQMSELQ